MQASNLKISFCRPQTTLPLSDMLLTSSKFETYLMSIPQRLNITDLDAGIINSGLLLPIEDHLEFYIHISILKQFLL